MAGWQEGAEVDEEGGAGREVSRGEAVAVEAIRRGEAATVGGEAVRDIAITDKHDHHKQESNNRNVK